MDCGLISDGSIFFLVVKSSRYTNVSDKTVPYQGIMEIYVACESTNLK